MNVLEDKVRTAMRETGDEIAPHSVPPLRPLGPPSRRGLPPIAGRWPGWLAPAAAAAAMIAVVVASLSIAGMFRGREPGSPQATQAVPAGRPAAPGGPAALRDAPHYFVMLTLTGPVQLIGGEAAAVRSTVTGRTLATVRPPAPYRIFTWVSAAADDRTFVLAAQRYWPIGSGQAGMPAEARDNITPTAFFKLTFDPATHTAKLARLAVPETIRSSRLAGMAVSPDGTRLALDLRQSVQVVRLATGAIRSWAWHGGGWIGNNKPIGQIFSWTADGRTLAFQQWEPGGPVDVRLLDTAAPGTDLGSAKIALTFANGGTFGLNTLLTPDGTRIVTATTGQKAEEITEFSTRTGAPVRAEDRFSAKAGWQEVDWVSPHGTVLIVSDPRGRRSQYGRDNIFGVLDGNRFTPIPHGADNTAAPTAW